MRKMIIDDISQITNEIIQLTTDFEKDALIVGYYETIVDAFNIIMKLTDNNFVFGELHPAEFDGYDDAYYLECTGGEISLGKVRWSDKDKYIMFEFDKAFVEEDFIDDFLTNNEPNGVVVFGFDDIDRDDNEDDNDFTICMDDDRNGFCFCIQDDCGHTKFKYRGSKELSDDDVMKIIRDYI